MIGNAFKGFDAAFASLKMAWAMILKVAIFFLIAHILISSLACYVMREEVFDHNEAADWCILATYYKYNVVFHLNPRQKNFDIKFPCEGKELRVTFYDFTRSYAQFCETKSRIIRANILEIIRWCAFLWILYPILIWYFGIYHKRSVRDKFLRGSTLVNATDMKTLLAERSASNSFQLTENIAVPEDIVTRHTFIIGKPGSGKTQLVSRFIEQLLARNVKIIIHDFKGDFINFFYDYRKHYIFNPLDKRHLGKADLAQYLTPFLSKCTLADFNEEGRNIIKDILNRPAKESENLASLISHSTMIEHAEKLFYSCNRDLKVDQAIIEKYANAATGWTLFNEFNSPIDIDAFCASLIPESASQDNFWPISARQLLGSIITYCLNHDLRSYDDLWKMVNLSNEDLLPKLQQTPGCEEGVKLLTEGKTANNVMAVLSNYTKPVKYLRGTDGDISIKAWVRDPDPEKKVIFLSNYSMIQETIKPFLTLFVDFATKTLCSLDDDLNRRLYFILDEFGQLSKISSVISLLTQSRSKGGAAMILIQDVSQINTTYGKDGCNSIVNSCGNTVCFAVSDEGTADYMSKKMGSQEIKRTEESRSLAIDDQRDSISINRSTTERRIVMPSELMTLPTMNFFIQLTDFPTSRDELTYVSYPKISDSYIGRDDLLFDKSAKNAQASGGVGESTGKTLPQGREAVQSSAEVVIDALNPADGPKDEEPEVRFEETALGSSSKIQVGTVVGADTGARITSQPTIDLDGLSSFDDGFKA